MADRAWWGEFSFALEQQRRWRLGERSIVLKRLENEWHSWNSEVREESDVVAVDCDVVTDQLAIEDVYRRHLQHNTADKVNILPLLADRSVVARPATPLTLLAGEKSRLFVSTPIWFYAETLPNRACLLDLPFWRPSDSWFGPSTRHGQLCYAKYTSARIQLTHLERRAHRAITPITVVNNHNKPLTIERINVPVTLLHLFSDDSYQLWTTAITVRREDNYDDVRLVLDKEAPEEAQAAKLISRPREVIDEGALIRSISSLFA